MVFDKMLEQYMRVINKLQDDESIRIFKSRVDYIITRNLNELENSLFDENKVYRCEEIDNMLRKEKRDIIIFGAGLYGRKTKKNLDCCKKYNIKAFCDNNKGICGQNIDGIQILTVEDAIKDSNSIIVVASRLYGSEMYEQLKRMNVEPDRILVPILGFPEIQCGWQYFDLFKPMNREVFIDAGTYDGGTIIDFYKWINGMDGICYGMEPVDNLYIIANKKILAYKNANIYKCAAWNKNEDILMTLDVKATGEIWGGNRVSEAGNVIIKGIKIDDIVSQNNNGVTMIKMDIEGSELKALEGAANSIKKYKPRLAISVYHKPEDVLVIADYILSLVEDYKLYFRHYTGDANETVLYASV